MSGQKVSVEARIARAWPAFGWPAAFLGLAVIFGLHRIVDPDLFQLAAVGRQILAHPSSIGVSNFIAAFPGLSYVEDKWLFSVLAAWVDRFGGGDGLMGLQIGLVLGVAVAWWVLLRRVCGAGGPLAALLGAAGLVAMAFRLEPRPETVSHALLALAIALVLAPPETLSARVRLGLGFALMIAWVNLHGYFINGLLVLAGAGLASLLGDRNVPSPRDCLRILGVSIVACLVHPQGWRALAWPFEQLLLLGREPILRESILEFFPTSDLFAGLGAARAILLVSTVPSAILFDRLAGDGPGRRLSAGLVAAAPWLAAPPPGFVPWPYRMTLALSLAALFQVPALIRGRRLFLPILFAGFTLLAWPLVRNLSLLVPVTLAILATSLAGVTLAGARGGLARQGRPRAAQALAVAAFVCVLLAGWARGADHLAPGTARAPGWAGWGIDERRFPAGAAAFIGRELSPGPILNTFDAGGFLLDRLGPGRAVFIAGNTSHYPASWLAEYRGAVMGGKGDPAELHDRYGAKTIVLEHAAMDTPLLISRLAGSRDWALVHLDEAAAVWVWREPALQDLIARYEVSDSVFSGLAKETAEAGSSPLPDFLAPRRRLATALNAGIFLRAAGRPGLAVTMARSMWDRDPAEELALFIAAAAEESSALPAQVAFLEGANARFPGSRPIASVLSRALFMRALSGVSLESRNDLDRAAALAPGEPGPLLALAKLAADEGQLDEARRQLALALALDRDGAIRRYAEADPTLAHLVGS